MSGIANSSRVRSNLLQLKQAADLIAQTKPPIGTSQRNSSPLDNRVDFFTAQGMSADDLQTLIDTMATGIDTILAAYNGIVAITKLVRSAQILISHAERTDDATVRAALASEFDALLGQIDRLARDAGCNDISLLSVNSFNDTADGDLEIDGDLAINRSQNNWANTPDIQGAADNLRIVLVTLQSQAQSLSSSLSAIQIRQDFTKAMINALQTGAENFTPTDNSEEGTNLLALQAQQQSSITALSLAAQAEQNVLRLLS